MADNSPITAKNEEGPVEESSAPTLETAPEADPQPKRKPGRPTGAKDGQKRKTPVRKKIVVEPLVPPQAPEPERPAEAPRAPEVRHEVHHEPEPVYQPPPPSPRTLMRYHRDATFAAERLEREERRKRTHDSIFNKLHVFPR
jgi:hypothetical protein